jgi:hypothetical protein
MIIVTLKINKRQTTHSFTLMSDALIFARSSEIGTHFEIREDRKLLAKGTIENYKDTKYDY